MSKLGTDQGPTPRKLIWRVALGLVAISFGASAQETNNTRSMSLKECVLLALQENYNLQIQRYNPRMDKARVNQAYADYEPTLTATVQHSDTTQPGGLDSQARNFGDSVSTSENASMQVTGLTPTGGRFTMGSSASTQDGTRSGNAFDNASAQGFIEFRQPLLKNMAIDSTRLNIRVSKQTLRITVLDLTQSMMETVNQIEEAYYDLIAARESVKVQETAVSLAEELARENARRIQIGTMVPLDEAEAQSQAASSRASLLSARQAVLTRQNVLKNAMIADYPAWQPVAIVPTHNLATDRQTFDLNSSWAAALSQRPDLLQARLSLEVRHMTQRFRKNQTLPQLDFTLRGGYAGSANEISDARKQLRDQDAPFYSAGLNLSLPLGNKRERENYRIAAMQTEQADLQLRQLRQTVMVQIDDSINQIRTNFERIQATREARELAEKALEAERKRLVEGASRSFIVLQQQRTLTAARFDELQSLTEYSKSISRLKLRQGSILREHQVNVVEDKE